MSGLTLSAMSRLKGPWPREARDTVWVLAVIGWIVGMQASTLPVWCSALAWGVLLWRAHLALWGKPLPAWGWRMGLLVVALAGTAWSHRTVVGHEAGVTLIVVLLALKTLELRARRDAFVVFFLGFFTLLTHFFQSQSLLTAIGILIGVLGLLTGLVLAHMPVGRPSLMTAMRWAGGMALLGAPIMLVLFMLFPRMAPLWGIPSDSALGRSGLSGQMQVGQIAQLALDDSIAFRVEFVDGRRPSQSQLYFRGPVLSAFDGTEWRPRHFPGLPYTATRLNAQTQGEPVVYRITLEPTNRPWLLTLEATPEAPSIGRFTAHATPDLQWLTTQPLTDVVRFEAVAYPDFRHGPRNRNLQLQNDLELPPGFNPRTLQLAQDLQRQFGPAPDPRQLVDAVLERLRTGGYTYTLEPGVFGRHTADEFWFDRRQGFCEHIASSFVILMRALDIPARVVTGYHGGERNPVDGLWTVRQSDAHAWAEIWLPEAGWTRVDPTAYVAPTRTSELSRLTAPPGLLTGALMQVNPTALLQLRAWWEATNNRWNQWVLNYTESRQLDLLRQLGVRSPSWTDLLYALGGVAALASTVSLLWMWGLRRRQDPWLRLLALARQSALRAGVALSPQATPRQLAAAIGPTAPGSPAAAWVAWLMAMEMQRYDPHSALNLSQLRRQWRLLPPWPRPTHTP